IGKAAAVGKGEARFVNLRVKAPKLFPCYRIQGIDNIVGRTGIKRIAYFQWCALKGERRGAALVGCGTGFKSPGNLKVGDIIWRNLIFLSMAGAARGIAPGWPFCFCRTVLTRLRRTACFRNTGLPNQNRRDGDNNNGASREPCAAGQPGFFNTAVGAATPGHKNKSAKNSEQADARNQRPAIELGFPECPKPGCDKNSPIKPGAS